MSFIDYWPIATKMLPTESFKSQLDYALKVRNRAIRLAIVRGEIAERLGWSTKSSGLMF